MAASPQTFEAATAVGRLAAVRASKSFGALRALVDVSFSVRQGEIHGLVGANGAGKSTLVGLLSAATEPDSGHIELDGSPVERYSAASAHEAGLRIIHQERQLCPALTVAQNICLGAVPLARGLIDHRRMEQQAGQTLTRLGSDLEVHAEVASISRADQQVVEIARAIHDSGRFLLMDEPTAALSHAESHLLLRIVEGLRDQACGVVYISHNLSEVIDVCDRITVLRDGQAVESSARGDLSLEALSSLVAGGATGVRKRKSLQLLPDEPVVASLEHLSAGQCRDVSFELHRGEVLALTGLLGAGHLDVGLALFGAVRPSAGRIEIDGQEVRLRSPADACSRGIGFVPPDRKTEGVLFDLSVAENAALPSVALRPPRLLSRAWTHRLADAWFPSLAVKANDLDAPMGTLSGGNQQKVVFAKWLAADARLLILAEPTSGIDVGAKEELCQLAERFASEGKSILLVSSDFDEVERLATRALVFRRGVITDEIVGAGITAEVLFDATG